MLAQTKSLKNMVRYLEMFLYIRQSYIEAI